MTQTDIGKTREFTSTWYESFSFADVKLTDWESFSRELIFKITRVEEHKYRVAFVAFARMTDSKTLQRGS